MKALKLATAALMLSSSLAFAQDADKSLHPTMGFCLELAQKMDTDKNGQVSQAEFMKMVGDLWSKKDSAKRGFLSHRDTAQMLLFLSGQTPQL